MKVKIWRSHGFCLGLHYQGRWNNGTEKRIYVLWWEINIDLRPEAEEE